LNPIPLELIKIFIGETIKELIKPKISADIAKERAFRLYSSLDKISIGVDDFVDELDAAIDFTNVCPIPHLIVQPMFDLADIVDKLSISVVELSKVLQDINPQLEIHNHELIENLKNYITTCQDLGDWRRSSNYYIMILLQCLVPGNQFDIISFPIINFLKKYGCEIPPPPPPVIHIFDKTGCEKKLRLYTRRHWMMDEDESREDNEQFKKWRSNLNFEEKLNEDNIRELNSFLIECRNYASKNSSDIKEIINDYRLFLASKFDFKDCF
jgi:hypothetical protein